jgi:hypothetical protein
LPRAQNQADAFLGQILHCRENFKAARLRCSHTRGPLLETSRDYGRQGGKKMYVSDGYTEFWRGTLRAFPEGLADFASALSSNDVDFVPFVIFPSCSIKPLQLNQ